MEEVKSTLSGSILKLLESIKDKATGHDSTGNGSTTSYDTCSEANMCSICGDVKSEAMTCSGKHNFCEDCFSNYARVAFENGSGAYFREQIENGSTSSIGELPCPLFSGGHCTCASLDHQVLARFFSKEMLDLWHEALGRIAVARSDEEQRRATRAQQDSSNQRTTVSVIREAVQDALSEGGSVSCPECHVQGEKDDGCIHITCQGCGCRWCYCCGRVRGSVPGRCSTCDRNSISLQNQPRFGFSTVGRENNGYAALHEFHTRRMGYFVRQIKSHVPANLWDQLRQEYPNLLTDVPTAGRQIDWNRIDTFCQPPVFGRTKARELAWINNATPIVRRLQQGLRNVDSTTDVAAVPPQGETYDASSEVTRSDEEQPRAARAQQNSNNRRTAVDVIREAVQDALSEGRSVACPKCHVQGERNDGCMHITCHRCRCRWCYCCGRVRGYLFGCSTCDRHSIGLHNQPNFGFTTVGHENHGYGALHEFHTRRMGYFVRQIKSHVPANLWDQLRQEHPNLLTDVPTAGRQIDWNRIDSFCQPPVFGRTKVRELAWINNAKPIVRRLQQGLRNVDSTTYVAAVPHRGQTCDASSGGTAAETNLLIEEILSQGGHESRNLVSQILGEDTGRRNDARRFFRVPRLGRRRPHVS